MQIQQLLPQQSIDSIMKDPQKYRKMMLIIEQTLYDLGYNESAKMLQKESGVGYCTEELMEVRDNLERGEFQQAIGVVERMEERCKKGHNEVQQMNGYHVVEPVIQNNQQNNHNYQLPLQQQQRNPHQQPHIQEQQNPQNSHPTTNPHMSPSTLSLSSLQQAKSMLYETYCMQKILNQQYDQAMRIISENITNDTKKEALCEALVLGNSHVTKEAIEMKKQEIFRFCLGEYQEIGEREIQKVIESYTQHEGEHNRELKKLLSTSKKLPPMKLLTSQFEQSIKHTITHMRLNPTTKQLILIDEGKDFQQIFYLKFQEKNYEYQKQVSQTGHLSLKLKYPIFTPVFNREVAFVYKGKRQAIESVAFNYNAENPLVAVASYSIIQIFDSKLDVIATVQAQNKIEKFIYMQFHPLSDLLYNCGYFQSMQILDSTGQQIASIYPYPKTRKFLFLKQEIIGISLVTNKIYKHSIDEQVLVRQKELDEGAVPMDVAISESKDKLAVSSLQFLYVVDVQSLEILGKTVSPNNPNKLTVQVKFYGQLLITLAKTFTCFQLQPDKTIQSPQQSLLITKLKQWSGQGTFDISDQLMVSGTKQILCWQQADMECMMEEESEFEEEMEANQEMRDVELQSEEEVVMMMENSDVEESDQEDNEEDSMDEEDDQEDEEQEVGI